ncbi:MAG: VWA domain-containing protein [Bryobacteraceae bacterium]
MNERRTWLRRVCVCLVVSALAAAVAPISGLRLNAQEAAQPDNVIRTETRLVLVDAVVTDKKGNYVRDLTGKDFRVWEDNKEQTVKTFSFGSDPASPTNLRNRYMVLFFDNASMDVGHQMQARQAALKFIDANAGPDRLMAIVNYGGNLQIAQNFTTDVDRLRKVVTGVKIPSVDPSGASTQFQLGSASGDFAVRDGIYALRGLAKNLSAIPGRKTLIWFTSGFPLNPEIQSEITATIDTCNKANVAIYPIDARGLVAGASLRRGFPDGPLDDTPALYARQAAFADGDAGAMRGHLQLASFITPASSLNANFQAHPGGPPASAPSGPPAGQTGGAHTTSPSTPTRPGAGKTPSPGTGNTTTGPRGGSSTTNQPYNQQYSNNPLNQARSIILPQFPPSATDNQQVMYQLAQGTGGFVILNTNDLLGGMDKIAKEQNEYYILGYTPAESDEGTCHSLKVKVDRGGENVRARTGYCNVKAVDYLAGKSSEKDLENRVAGTAPGNVNASIQAPFFYTSPNTARVNVAMEIPSDSLKFQKEKGNKLHSEMNVLGVAYKADGSVAAKFSDTVKFDLDKKELESFHEKPIHYEKQFEMASGQYNLKVAFNGGGEQFGKLEAPLKIDPFATGQFSMSSLTLSKEIHPVSEMTQGLDAALLEDQVPLVIGTAQVIPAGTNHFKRTDKALVLYGEIYEPKMVGADPQKPPAVAIQMKVTDRKTAEVKLDSGLMRIPVKLDNAVVPFALQIPPDKLTAGAYRLEVKGVDSLNQSYTRTIDFDWD